MLSIIIPCETESSNLLSESICSLRSISPKNYEIIIVEKQEAPTRAEKLNIGFHRSKGELILFHHPRSMLSREGFQHLIEMSESFSKMFPWGGFTHCFNMDHPILRFTSWYSNQIRAKWRGILYLDHCIFFDRNLWLQDHPKMEIFEDTELSIRFRVFSKPLILSQYSVTSSIRFKKNGILYQSIINQILKLGYYFNCNPKFMNRVYEKGLNLN
ncbi:MAG: hypothetical protein JJT78_11405 [Leptospira sp.]|nr:hypothetical protein [Leptospira sp.]